MLLGRISTVYLDQCDYRHPSARMNHRAGTADLPLHGGRVPQWLSTRMADIGRAITEAVVHHYGREDFLRRLAHPFWFQSFGAVMGMDWHSSGITTSVIGALRRGLAPVSDELGIYVCGGRGRYSRRTPSQLIAAGEKTGLDGEKLAQTSRLVAKVDSAAVLDGFSLYLHAFILSADGQWTVVQQGMAPEQRLARRYHWHSNHATDPVNSPHTGIDGVNQGVITNLTDPRAKSARALVPQLVNEGPDRVVKALLVLPRANEMHLTMPAHHAVRASDVRMRRLHATLAAACEAAPQDFAELLQLRGVGARTVESLALVSEVIHGAPSRFTDPARFSYAHGGKDGHPFPVPLGVYDETIRVMREGVERAKLGRPDQLFATKRLSTLARSLEGWVEGPSWAELVRHERRLSPARRGRAVGYDPGQPDRQTPAAQMDLFTAPLPLPAIAPMGSGPGRHHEGLPKVPKPREL